MLFLEYLIVFLPFEFSRFIKIRECLLLSYKRMFGEYVTAIRFDHIIKEILLKTSFDDLFRSITVIICTSY